VEKVVFNPEVEEYFETLLLNLFEKNYFSYVENAHDYVEAIVKYAVNYIPILPSKKAPLDIQNLGTHYITYTPNNRTTWYILFFKNNNRYLVTHITNNHSSEAAFMNEDE
jgi:hypothetical protein